MVSLICVLGFVSAVSADAVIEQRMQDGLQDMINNPWPYPEVGWEAKYAGLMIYTNQHMREMLKVVFHP